DLSHETADHQEDPRVIVVAALDQVVKPVGAERRPVAVYLDHEVTCAGLETGAERVRGPLSHGGTRGVVKVRSPGGDWSGGRVRPGGRGARALAGAATQGREREGDQ